VEGRARRAVVRCPLGGEPCSPLGSRSRASRREVPQPGLFVTGPPGPRARRDPSAPDEARRAAPRRGCRESTRFEGACEVPRRGGRGFLGESACTAGDPPLQSAQMEGRGCPRQGRPQRAVPRPHTFWRPAGFEDCARLVCTTVSVSCWGQQQQQHYCVMYGNCRPLSAPCARTGGCANLESRAVAKRPGTRVGPKHTQRQTHTRRRPHAAHVSRVMLHVLPNPRTRTVIDVNASPPHESHGAACPER
jgi:hypothetical protein